MTKNNDQEKQAAVGLLVETGVDFEDAVKMVEKKASEMEKSAIANLVAGYMGARDGDKLGGTILGGGIGGSLGAGAGVALGHGLHNPHLAGLAGTAGLVAGGFYGGKLYSNMKHHNDPKPEHEAEKKAAVGLLIERGVDFETAVSLVEQKAAELA